jgi:hypothetical protein
LVDQLARNRSPLNAGGVSECRACPHLFCTGDGPSSPSEYEPAQHLDPAVVTDIADWLTG